MNGQLAELTEDWSRPWKISRVMGALDMGVPERLRREKLEAVIARLGELGFEATLADLSPVASAAPSMELKVRLRRKPRVIFSRYRVLKKFHSGGMSSGFHVSTNDGAEYFVKVVQAEGAMADALQRELGVYAKVHLAEARHILTFHTVERDEERIGLVTEFAAGGTLREYVTARGPLAPPEAMRIARDIVTGLEELHALQIVHRDLKHDNILLAGELWKLADFGISKDLRRLVTRGRTFKDHGTPGFAPPEQWLSSEAHPSADVYAFGGVLAYLVTGKTYDDPATGAVAALEGRGLGSWAGLVRRCTARSPEERPSLDAVASELGRL